MSNISLVVFTSTKGNYGFKDIYKTEMDDLSEKVGLDYFVSKFVHIKDCGDDNLSEMSQYYQDKGFDVVITQGNYKHFNSSNHVEYLKDLIKVFTEYSHKIKSKYILFFESDFLLRANKHNIRYWLDYAQEILDKNPNIYHVRFPRRMDDYKDINNIRFNFDSNNNFLRFLQYKAAKWVSGDKEDYLIHNEFSFCPHVVRLEDVIKTYTIIKENFEKYKFHCEIGTEFAMVCDGKWDFSDGSFIIKKLPFVSLDPELVRSIHIGEENYPQLKKKWC